MLPSMRVRMWEARVIGRWSGLVTGDQAVLVMVRFRSPVTIGRRAMTSRI